MLKQINSIVKGKTLTQEDLGQASDYFAKDDDQEAIQ
jgi:hypothetical protein